MERLFTGQQKIAPPVSRSGRPDDEAGDAGFVFQRGEDRAGTGAARRIRALLDGQEVKIAAITASAFKEELPELFAAGMNDFVRKPCRVHHSGNRGKSPGIPLRQSQSINGVSWAYTQ